MKFLLVETTTDNNKPLHGTGWSPQNKIPCSFEVLFSF